MVCWRFVCLTLVFCVTFTLANEPFKGDHQIIELLDLFRELNETPPAVIKRMENDLANGKTTYNPDEFSELFK